ncbi:glutamate dehydrogenase, partial [Sulfolobus sp. A20-N-F6]
MEEVLSSSLYTQQVKKLYKVGEILGLDNETLDTLSKPERVIQVKIQIRGSDGKIKTFMGWRSQHNSALGPYKGGVRYHPNVTEDEVVALSMIMTWKNSLLLLPYGGGKGGIRVDPQKLT